MECTHNKVTDTCKCVNSMKKTFIHININNSFGIFLSYCNYVKNSIAIFFF